MSDFLYQPIYQEVFMHQMQDSDMTRCISNCLATQRACLEALNYCLEEKGTSFSGKHIQLMQACVETCNLSVRLMSMHSDFHQQACELCFEVCEACSIECEKYEYDDVFKHAAEACRRSAESCRGMSGMTVKVNPSQERGHNVRM
jgi:hypothetical protein